MMAGRGAGEDEEDEEGRERKVEKGSVRVSEEQTLDVRSVKEIPVKVLLLLRISVITSLSYDFTGDPNLFAGVERLAAVLLQVGVTLSTWWV